MIDIGMKLISYFEHRFSASGVYHHSQVMPSSHFLESFKAEFALNPEWMDGKRRDPQPSIDKWAQSAISHHRTLTPGLGKSGDARLEMNIELRLSKTKK